MEFVALGASDVEFWVSVLLLIIALILMVESS